MNPRKRVKREKKGQRGEQNPRRKAALTRGNTDVRSKSALDFDLD